VPSRAPGSGATEYNSNGSFHFWVSLSLRLSLSTKFVLRPKISQKMKSFLPRDAMLKRGLCCHAVSVRHVRGSRQNE